MELLTVLPALCGLIVALLQLWSSKKPERIAEELNETIQDIRQDIADGDESNVSVAIDSVPASSNPQGLRDDQDTQRRLTAITGH
jgi:hypothetical protein